MSAIPPQLSLRMVRKVRPVSSVMGEFRQNCRCPSPVQFLLASLKGQWPQSMVNKDHPMGQCLVLFITVKAKVLPFPCGDKTNVKFLASLLLSFSQFPKAEVYKQHQTAYAKDSPSLVKLPEKAHGKKETQELFTPSPIQTPARFLNKCGCSACDPAGPAKETRIK